jgi:serine/threonine-protein kinase
MAVGGDDDTIAGSLPTFTGSMTPVPENELIAGRYRIMRFIGSGGMGRVYEALDTELGEKVALKVVKAGLDDDALERFRREVKLTRRIVHTNVARMFDIGEHNGERFLTMELVDGEPLTRQMTGKPMPWPQVKAIAEQLCAGLAAAHAAGVVHRDLKPDNVLIERGTDRAVLTDFGIARSGDDPSVTQVGAVVGTPRYMSPEQLAGTEVDARADLFSLGVMLFELATATRPWAGDNAISIAVSQATMAPRSIDTTSSTVPAYFAATVAACLQLDPKDRPASAAEVAAAIAEGRPVAASAEQLTRTGKQHDVRPRTPTGPRVVATMPAPEPTSLVVMPIQCAPDDEYLADGLREDLIDTLCATPGIRVKPAGVARGVGQPDPREVGRQLSVDHVAVGSLRRTPKGLRVATRLISSADGFQIWAHKTDCSEAEVLDVANELAKGLADALSTHASPEAKVTDQHAVDLFLRAKAELRRFWGTHAQNAATLLDQAVEYAPTPQILAAAAYAHVQAWVMRGEAELLPPAERALERALAAGHGEVYLASAQYQLNRGNLLAGARDAARALVRAPMTAQVHELAARLLVEIEGTANARVHYEMARGLDPGRANVIDNDLTRIDALEQKWNDADARNARLLADPDLSIQQLGMIQRARLAAWRGQNEIIKTAGKNFVSRVSPNAGAIFKLVEVLSDDGKIDHDRWNAVMAIPLDPNKPTRQYLIRTQVFVEIALSLDEPTLALDALERLDRMGFSDKTWIELCPLHGKITDQPRYAAVAKSVRHRAAEALEAFRSISS